MCFRHFFTCIKCTLNYRTSLQVFHFSTYECSTFTWFNVLAVRFDDDTILYSQSDSTCYINARFYRNDHIFCKYRIGFSIGYWFFVNLKTYAMPSTMIKFLGISMFFNIITTNCIKFFTSNTSPNCSYATFLCF